MQRLECTNHKNAWHEEVFLKFQTINDDYARMKKQDKEVPEADELGLVSLNFDDFSLHGDTMVLLKRIYFNNDCIKINCFLIQGSCCNSDVYRSQLGF